MKRGVSRSSRTWRRGAVAARHRSMRASCSVEQHADERCFADGQAVWSRHPDAGVKPATMLSIAQVTVARKPGRRGERGVSRKPFAQGRPGCTGQTCGSCPVHFYSHGGHGCWPSTRSSLRPLVERGDGGCKARASCTARLRWCARCPENERLLSLGCRNALLSQMKRFRGPDSLKRRRRPRPGEGSGVARRGAVRHRIVMRGC
jgi:hypothetical protein